MFDQQPTVYLVDDDAAVLRAMGHLLRSAGYRTESFSSAGEFLREHDPMQNGCILLDVAMPGLDGLALQSALRQECCHLPIIFLTGRGDIATSVQAMKAGAADFLTKPVEGDVLLAAIEAALVKERSDEVRNGARAHAREQINRLTDREREVLGQIVAGRLNKQIAGSLGTCERTVKFHRSNLMAKLKAHHVAELLHVATEAGFEPIPPEQRSQD